MPPKRNPPKKASGSAKRNKNQMAAPPAGDPPRTTGLQPGNPGPENPAGEPGAPIRPVGSGERHAQTPDGLPDLPTQQGPLHGSHEDPQEESATTPPRQPALRDAPEGSQADDATTRPGAPASCGSQANDLLVSEGSDPESDDEWLRAAKNSKWAQKVCFVTQSYTDHQGLENPKDRKDFARMVNVVAKEALKTIELESIAVFKEPHRNGHFHYHAIVVAKAKTTQWSRIQDLLAERKVRVNVRTVPGQKTG